MFAQYIGDRLEREEDRGGRNKDGRYPCKVTSHCYSSVVDDNPFQGKPLVASLFCEVEKKAQLCRNKRKNIDEPTENQCWWQLWMPDDVEREDSRDGIDDPGNQMQRNAQSNAMGYQV
jgi:hypothetical protein